MKKLKQIHFVLYILSALVTVLFLVISNKAEVRTQQSKRFNFHGEYGLWVQEKNNQIIVHWMTMKSDSGYLKVVYEDIVFHTFTTPQSQVHEVSFEKEENSDLTLRYGSLNNKLDRHETTIYLNFEKPNRLSTFEKVDSIFVVGDIHGEYDTLRTLLINGGIIDSNLRWTANRSHLVLLGDIFDRGHDVIKTLWLLYDLERQAQKYGGKVHVVLGNHEIMIFLNDLRYVSGKEKLIAQYHGTNYTAVFDIRESVLGKWLASKPGMLKINNVLFAHGGVSTDFMNFSIETFNDSLYAFMHEDEFPFLREDGKATIKGDSSLYAWRRYFFLGRNSVFWHRGYVQTDTLKNDLKKVLKKYKAKLHIVAHTPVPTIQELYDGLLIAVELPAPPNEMLLLVRKKRNKHKKYKYKINGPPEEL